MTERLSLERAPDNLTEIAQPDLDSLAKLYARVFAGEPWNEYTVCSQEGAFFGMNTQPGQGCPQPGCYGELSPAYPPDTTARYIAAELARPDAALWLLRDSGDRDRMVGFSWGFSYPSPEAFAEDKYKTPEMRVAISALLCRLDTGVSGLWYLSESGIEDDVRYRGWGWSRSFHERRLEVAQSLGLDAVQRTSSRGNMYRTSKRTMTQIMGPEMLVDARTRQSRPTNAIINDVVDTENPERVLFARPAVRAT